MSSGQILSVVATDKETPKDFEVFCRQTGNELLLPNHLESIFLLKNTNKRKLFYRFKTLFQISFDIGYVLNTNRYTE